MCVCVPGTEAPVTHRTSFCQELQRENTFLRAQFAQKTEALSKEKSELEKKLSASEVDAQLIRESLRVALQKHSEEGKKQEERVSDSGASF